MHKKILVVVSLLFLTAFGDPAYFSNQNGNKLFEAGKYEEALKEYETAVKNDPDYATAQYNRGAALHKLGKYKEALEAYDKAGVGGNSELKKHSHFNGGAVLLEAGDNALKSKDQETANKYLNGSAERFQSILKNDPTNNDARHNLELALKKLEELEKQQEEEQEKQKQEQEKEESDKEEEKEEGDEEESENGEQDKPDNDESGEENEGDEQGEEEKNETGKDGNSKELPKTAEHDKITEKQARQIFNAIEQDERELRDKIRGEAVGSAPPTDKDW